MHRPFLVGDKLYLRPIEASDLEGQYLDWLNDPAVTHYLETGKFPVTLTQVTDYVKRFESSPTQVLLCIIDKEADQHIGNVSLYGIDWVHRITHTGLMIGNKDFWGKGYGFEAWSLIIEYAFDRLGLRKIIAGTAVENQGSAAVLKKLGFQVEGVFRQEMFIDGQFQDGSRFGMFRNEFHKFAG